jgi:H+-transporting ATPase
MSLTSSSRVPDATGTPASGSFRCSRGSGWFDQRRSRLSQFGPNALAEKARPAWQAYLAKFWSPIPWLLEAAMIVEIGLGKYVEASVIAALLLFNPRVHPGMPRQRSAQSTQKTACRH